MISIVILGTGNVAKHLFDVFLKCEGTNVLQVWGRNKDRLSHFKEGAAISDAISGILEADLYMIAVSDDAVSEVARSLIGKKGLVVHTSGSVPLHALANQNRRGVFYPLQSFSKDREIDFKSVPICIEAETKTDLALLAESISNDVREISSEQRKSLHLAAVFVNNFTNHLFQIGNEICAEHGLPFGILLPLIGETVQKLGQLSPSEAQTGPARRNDHTTIKNHLDQLKNKDHRDIYALLSKSISEKYGQKL
jgi:predicted short-subunit dehydrogenase-like oxidoreductase (DUF2520 family)